MPLFVAATKRLCSKSFPEHPIVAEEASFDPGVVHSDFF